MLETATPSAMCYSSDFSSFVQTSFQYRTHVDVDGTDWHRLRYTLRWTSLQIQAQMKNAPRTQAQIQLQLQVPAQTKAQTPLRTRCISRRSSD